MPTKNIKGFLQAWMEIGKLVWQRFCGLSFTVSCLIELSIYLAGIQKRAENVTQTKPRNPRIVTEYMVINKYVVAEYEGTF